MKSVSITEIVNYAIEHKLTVQDLRNLLVHNDSISETQVTEVLQQYTDYLIISTQQLHKYCK